MSLSLQAVDRLFDRLTATYGRQFLGLYEGLDVSAVKTLWAHELAGFAPRLHDIAWALEHLPERAPNVIEFRNLCRKAPAPDTPRLPEPPADPARLRAEMAKLGEIMAAPVDNSGKAWAHRIIARHDAGDRVALASLKLARAAIAPRTNLGQ